MTADSLGEKKHYGDNTSSSDPRHLNSVQCIWPGVI